MKGLLAHAGGFSWDEMLFLALPIAVLALLGWQARRRANDDASDIEPESPKNDDRSQ